MVHEPPETATGVSVVVAGAGVTVEELCCEPAEEAESSLLDVTVSWEELSSLVEVVAATVAGVAALALVECRVAVAARPANAAVARVASAAATAVRRVTLRTPASRFSDCRSRSSECRSRLLIFVHSSSRI
jgi:hypothetical protein